MIVFVVDPANREAFAERFAFSFPAWQQRFKVADYVSLASAERVPTATYVFFDLLRSTEGRISQAAEFAALLCNSGAEVVNEPSRMDALGRRFESAAALDGRQAAPLVLRAEAPDAFAESPILETEEEYRATLIDWILQGNEPHRIRALPAPSAAPDGQYRRFGAILAGGLPLSLPALVSSHWPPEESSSSSNDFPAPPTPEGFESFDGLVRIETVWRDDQPFLWRLDDSAACLLRPPLLGPEEKRALEAFLESKERPAEAREEIAVKWPPLFRA